MFSKTDSRKIKIRRKLEMKKKILRLTVMIVQLFSISVFATENEDLPVITLQETRTNSEIENLESIYERLFPDEYHYIKEYQENGVREMDIDKIEMLFYGTKELDDKSYDLIVMNNGQIFTNISEVISDIAITRASSTKTGNFTVGDLGHYNTFTITYTINTSGYDKINSCDNVTGSGFYLYPTNKSVKWTEDANGPAHYGYNNVSMNYDGSGVLYDIGVAVGNDKAKGISQISTGADMWLWAFLYAFFF